MKVKTTKTGKKDVLTHLLDTSNMGYEEVNILLSKHIVTNIKTQNFVLRYTTAYGTPHHGVTTFTVPSLDPTTMAQLNTAQQTE